MCSASNEVICTVLHIFRYQSTPLAYAYKFYLRCSVKHAGCVGGKIPFRSGFTVYMYIECVRKTERIIYVRASAL